MANAVFDIKASISVSETVLTNKYRYVVPAGKVLILKEVSLSGDTTFQSNGKVLIRAGNDVVTSEGSNTNEVVIPQNISLPFPSEAALPELWKTISSSGEITVDARVTSGTGILHVAITGMLIDWDIWNTLQRAIQKRMEGG